jgi:hypothetical protein
MRDDHDMRTTLDLDDDVLQAAKEIGALRRLSAGQVVSQLVRKALQADRSERSATRNGVPLLARAAGSPPLTMAAVNRLRDA